MCRRAVVDVPNWKDALAWAMLLGLSANSVAIAGNIIYRSLGWSLELHMQTIGSGSGPVWHKNHCGGAGEVRKITCKFDQTAWHCICRLLEMVLGRCGAENLIAMGTPGVGGLETSGASPSKVPNELLHATGCLV